MVRVLRSGAIARPALMRTHTFHVELKEGDYLALLKAAPKEKPITTRLAAAEHAPGRRGGVFIFRGSRAEGLLLQALALLHARDVMPAIDRALAAAEKAEGR